METVYKDLLTGVRRHIEETFAAGYRSEDGEILFDVIQDIYGMVYIDERDRTAE